MLKGVASRTIGKVARGASGAHGTPSPPFPPCPSVLLHLPCASPLASHALPLSQVAEAKARKQRRLQRALTKAKKKASRIAAQDDLTEGQKAKEVERIYKKKIQDPKDRKKKTLIVGRKATAGPSGKSKFGVKMVDKRYRSDSRGEKTAAKNKKGKAKGGVTKGQHGGKSPGARKTKNRNYNRAGRK